MYFGYSMFSNVYRLLVMAINNNDDNDNKRNKKQLKEQFIKNW